ncbi:MAG: NIPSNAP family protein [Gemmatales bacterium]
MKRAMVFSALVLAMAVGWGAQTLWAKHLEEANRVFELRIYSVLPGRMDAMNARFKNHTNALLTKHGMTLIGFWQPQGEDANKKLYYLVAHKSRKDAEASWKAFVADPDWKKAQAASEADGKIVEKVDRVWLDPTAYSMMK